MRICHPRACGCGLILTIIATIAPSAHLQSPSRDKPSETPVVSSQTAVPGNVVDFTASDSWFEGPESIPAGLTTFRLRQVGKFAHDMAIFQLPDGRTFEEFVALAVADQPRPWAIKLGGPGFIDPPLATNVTLVLEPATYVLASFTTSPGMFKHLHVVPSPGAVLTEPPTDLVVKILDGGYEFSPTLSAGRHLLRIENAASERRLFRMERILPGRTVEEALAWRRQRLTVPQTERPTEPKGRLAEFEPGRHLIMAVDLDPGTYLVSSLPNRATSQAFVVR
jgi:hypothetical protein